MVPARLGYSWEQNSLPDCLTELTARVLKSCRRVGAVMAGRSPCSQYRTAGSYMKYTCPLLHAASSNLPLSTRQFVTKHNPRPPCHTHIYPRVSYGASQLQGSSLSTSSHVPRCGSCRDVLPSRTEFETAVIRLKVLRMRTAAQILSGTLSVAFRAKLLAGIRETWPAIRITAPPKTLIF